MIERGDEHAQFLRAENFYEGMAAKIWMEENRPQ
jgi:hypothetical protein